MLSNLQPLTASGSYKINSLSASWQPTTIFALTGSYVTATSGGGSVSGATASTVGSYIPGNMTQPAKDICKRIKIPWRMYKLTDIPDDKKRSLSNGQIITEAIQSWWNRNQWASGCGWAVSSLTNVHIVYLNLVMDRIPLELNGNLVEKIGILPIATFRAQDPTKIEDNDFVFGGTMKISKTDPTELIAVTIEDIEVIGGKYEMKL